MNIIPHKLSRRTLLVLFGLPVFSLLVIQREPQTISARVGPGSQPFAGGAESRRSIAPGQSPSLLAGAPKNTAQFKVERDDSNNALKFLSQLAKTLAKTGPVFGPALVMNKFSVQGFVKGNWPMVIHYSLEADSTAEVMIKTKNKKLAAPIRLESTNGQRRLLETRLPEAFGKKPDAGEVSIQAFKNGPGPRKPAEFFLYGLGMGDNAVGSMVIEKLRFQPRSIHPKLNEKALYGFYSKSDFNKASAEFWLQTYSPERGFSSRVVAREEIKGVVRLQSVERYWDGKTSKGKISLGDHQFFLIGWRSRENGGDWVFAAEEQVVTVE